MILKQAHKTEIYVNTTGYLIIHQLRDGEWLDPVMLSPDQCLILEKELPKYFDLQKNIWLLDEQK